MLKKLLLLVLASSSALSAEVIVISPQCVRHKSQDRIYVCFENKQFYIANASSNVIKPVDMAFSDKMIREFKSQKHLDAFFKHDGKLVVRQFDNGDYALNAHMPLKGGGAVLAFLGYTLTKAAGYTAILTGFCAVGTISTAAGPGGAAVTAGTTLILTQTGGTAAILASIEAAALKMCLVGALVPGPI